VEFAEAEKAREQAQHQPDLFENYDIHVRGCKHQIGIRSRLSHSATGARIWPASVVLAHWLCSRADVFKSGDSVLELGAGTAFPSIVALLLGLCKQVCISDCDDRVLVNSKHCVEHNAMLWKDSAAAISFECIDVEDETTYSHLASSYTHVNHGSGFDVVMAVDMFYGNSMAAHVLHSLPSLMAPHGRCYAMLALERDNKPEFELLCQQRGFTAIDRSIELEQVQSEVQQITVRSDSGQFVFSEANQRQVSAESWYNSFALYEVHQTKKQ